MPWNWILLIVSVLGVWSIYKVLRIGVLVDETKEDEFLTVSDRISDHYRMRAFELWSRFSWWQLFILLLALFFVIPVTFVQISALADMLVEYEPALKNVGSTGYIQFSSWLYRDGMHQKAVWWAQVMTLSQVASIYLTTALWLREKKDWWNGFLKLCAFVLIFVAIFAQEYIALDLLFTVETAQFQGLASVFSYSFLRLLFLFVFIAVGAYHKHIRTFVALVWFYLDRVLLWGPMNLLIWIVELGATKQVALAEVEDDVEGESRNPERQPHPPQPEGNLHGGEQDTSDDSDDVELGEPDDEEKTDPTCSVKGTLPAH